MIRRLHTEEDGQALLWGAGVIVLIVALFYGAIDIGELVLGKIEAQNAADAAAMTGSAVKASMHNTRALAYRAASGQLSLARIQLVRATGLALQEIQSPGKFKADYDKAIKLSTSHRKKLALLRDGIVQYNAWAVGDQAGPMAIKQAAGAAYKANLGVLGTMIPQNMNLMNADASLPELTGGFANSVTFRQEAMTPNGIAGKTAVVVEPQVAAFGGGLLGYGERAQLSATSVAGFVDAHQALGQNLGAVGQYGVTWYVTKLMPVGKGNLK